jgi:putative transposase
MRLSVTPQQAEEIDRRFEAGRRVYNAVLGEMRRRLDLVRCSRQWQRARKTRNNKTKRSQLFNEAKKQYGFSRIEAIKYARGVVRQAFADRLNINDADCLAKRAFEAVNRVALGRSRSVRFKGANRLRSMESDAPDSGIRFRNGHLLWRNLSLLVRNRHTGGNHGARHQALREHALQQRICFARLIRQRHGTQVRYYVQLVLQGTPLPTVQAGDRVLGIDLNVSKLAYAGQDAAGLLVFAPGLADQRRHIRRVQRHLDRQRRANNPDNYRQDGTIRPGPKRWKVSRRMQVVADRLTDLQRRQADRRHNENGRIANQVVSVGKYLKTESVSVKGWQKSWGRRIGKKAPAGCMTRIARKAESAGGYLVRFPTRSTALSQTCICGRVAKKSLDERMHLCPHCGLQMHRDLLSAYLAAFVEGERLHADQALSAWSGAEPHLRAAWSNYPSARAGLCPAARRGQSGSRAKVA